MIGRTIRSRHGVPWAAVVFLLLAAVSVGAGLANNSNTWLLLAVLPCCIAGACLLGRHSFAVEFTEQGLVRPGQPLLPYEAIESLEADRSSHDPQVAGKKHYPIQVLHRAGILLIPPRLDVPSDDVYRFLHERLSPSGSRAVHPDLAAYVAGHEQRYGAAQVRTYRARAHLGARRKGTTIHAIGCGCITTGVLWALAGFLGADWELWAGLGLLVGLAGLTLVLLRWLDNDGSRSIKNWQQASLVVGPAGLAMIQGEVQGELSWRQVRDVQYNPKPSMFTVEVNRLRKGVFLHVEGAHIVIADIYDRPLYAIYQGIQYCRLRYE